MHHLSDASRRRSPAPYLLVDARRRSRSLHDPLFQCDRSCLHAHAPWISRDSAPLSILGQRHARGIGTATPFVLTYALAGRYERFEATIGRDDAGHDSVAWSLDVYLDDLHAGRWPCAADASVHVHLDTGGAREMVLVGVGPDENYVILAGARLHESPNASPRCAAARHRSATRQRLLEFDDRLVIEGEALLTARAAFRISAQGGLDDRPEALGGFGRTTSSRGADMWAAVGGRGDRLRWQTLLRHPGPYRGWVRVVSAEPGRAPSDKDYRVNVDGHPAPLRAAGPHIVERMPCERYSGHLWGYLCFEADFPGGVHEVEVINSQGAAVAVNRVVLLRRRRRITALLPTHETAEPMVDAQRRTADRRRAHTRWQPKPIAGQHYVVCEEADLFTTARDLGLLFAPDLHNYRDIDATVVSDRDWYHRARAEGKAFTLDLLKGRRIGATYAAYLEHMLAAALPFTIHTLFSTSFDAPLIDAAVHARLCREGGDHWQGFHTTEWADHYNFSPEARADPPPTSRAEAYDRARRWYQQRAAMHYDDVTAMCGSWRWEHYAGAWSGGRGFQDEPGPSPGAQLNCLFTRGAARQYGRHWHSEIAPGTHDGYAWVENDYMTGRRPHDTRAHEDAGCSISWYRRIMTLTYMWGSQSFWSEVPAFTADTSPDGRRTLSPMGRATDDFCTFVATHPERGIAYTPVGLVLDRMHGWSGRQLYPDRYPNLTWTHLQPTGGDLMKDALFELLYPGHSHTLNEHHALSATPYGDLFDIMLTDATSAHLADYPVLFLVGDVAVDMDAAVVAKLENYVQGGGTLVINVAQSAGHFEDAFLGLRVADTRGHAANARCLREEHVMTGRTFTFQHVQPRGAEPWIATPEGEPLVTRHRVGAGQVIVTTVPFLLQDSSTAVCFLPHFLEHLTRRLLPFHVTGDVSFSANRTDNAWLLTLMNHDGIYKLPTEPTLRFPHHARRVVVTFDETPGQVSDWMTKTALRHHRSSDGRQVIFDVPPGDLRILRIADA